MADNLGVNPIPFSSEDEGIDFPTKAKLRVEETMKKIFNTPTIEPAQVYVVWFAYVMGGWKAIVSTTIADGRIYEVTYNKAKDETYVDVYIKHRQEIFGDG